MNSRALIESIEVEYKRYKTLGESAIAQVSDQELTQPFGGNSIAVIVWHLAGNLTSRFTDFLTTDGEKPWRKRDEEFIARETSKAEALTRWEPGWKVLFATLAALSDADLNRTVTIRNQTLLVHEALHRSLAHASYHVGQIVLIAKSFRGSEWKYLSIPPGGSQAYNQNPTLEKGAKP
ncbi:MAG TPA: DUF1572 family protein [Planctomycetota bacterium]|nr:DUF1572 family protein [Planctomycetota bacterium]